MRRTATECFNAQRTRTGKTIEHPCAVDMRPQDVEQRLAQLVGGRPDTLPRWRLEPAPLEVSGDHTHVQLPKILDTCSRTQHHLDVRAPSIPLQPGRIAAPNAAE